MKQFFESRTDDELRYIQQQYTTKYSTLPGWHQQPNIALIKCERSFERSQVSFHLNRHLNTKYTWYISCIPFADQISWKKDLHESHQHKMFVMYFCIIEIYILHHYIQPSSTHEKANTFFEMVIASNNDSDSMREYRILNTHSTNVNIWYIRPFIWLGNFFV